jgi:putative colanic acid biosynthesis glycosyltransferase
MIDISLVTVAKNNLAGLEKTYESILNQDIDLKRIEWIVKDSASTDGTADFLSRVEARKCLPNFIRDDSPDQSLYDGMNIGMTHMTGKYVLFLNSGDYLHAPDVLSRTAEVIMEYSDNRPTFLFGHDLVKNIDGQFVLRKARDVSYLWHSLPCSHQAIFYNTGHIGNIRYNLKYPICADYQFTLEIYKHHYKGHRNLNFIVPVFVAGGHAIQHRLQLCEEAYMIKKEINHTPLLVRSFSFLAGYTNNILMHNFPKFYTLHRRFFDKMVDNPN